MQNINSAKDVINSIVSISRFNRGEAAKIFDEVSNTGVKVVLKNNSPACVLMSPEKYVELMDMLEDYELAIETQKRLENDDGVYYSQEEVLKMLNITKEDIKNAPEVELE